MRERFSVFKPSCRIIHAFNEAMRPVCGENRVDLAVMITKNVA
jgi:hypothetical protein